MANARFGELRRSSDSKPRLTRSAVRPRRGECHSPHSKPIRILPPTYYMYDGDGGHATAFSVAPNHPRGAGHMPWISGAILSIAGTSHHDPKRADSKSIILVRPLSRVFFVISGTCSVGIGFGRKRIWQNQPRTESNLAASVRSASVAPPTLCRNVERR